ncbi:MAG: ATP-binding protein [bacterium]
MKLTSEERLKVIIVDDEEGMCLGAKRIVRDFVVEVNDLGIKVSFDVKYVTRGKEYLDLLEKEKFDITLIDYKLPDCSGLDILEKITKKGYDMIPIMITAYATFEAAVQATKLGAHDFIAKPFTPDELRSSLRKATVHLLLARHARKSEEEKRKLRFQFISILSHELKAPLAAIEGYLNILQKRYETISKEDYDMMLGRSLVRLEGMRKLIFDLLDVTRIESGDKKRNFEEINIEDMAKSSVEMANFEAAKRNIKIELNIKTPVKMHADKGEIEIILNNLITNAVKYNKENGRVDIVLEKNDNKIRIAVSDTGIGLEKEDISRLFEEFVRIKNEHTIGILGSGLGLSTIKKLAKLYGGEVTVQSVVGEGSTFTVELSS